MNEPQQLGTTKIKSAANVGGQRIVEILEAIQAATEASAKELAAIRQLLETDTAHAARQGQGQGQRSAQAPTPARNRPDTWTGPEGEEADEDNEAEKAQAGRGATSYDAYRASQRPQTPTIIKFASPDQDTRRSGNYPDPRNRQGQRRALDAGGPR